MLRMASILRRSALSAVALFLISGTPKLPGNRMIIRVMDVGSRECGQRTAEQPVVLMQNLSDSEVAEGRKKGNG